MIQKHAFQIYQKLAIAAALAAAFYCLPLTAQTVQPDSANAQKTSIDGTQILHLKDGRKMSLAQIAGLPEVEKEDVLDNQLTKEQFKTLLEWRKLLLAQTNQHIAEKDVALKLSKEFGVVLDEIFKEQRAPKLATPEQQAINKKRAATIKAALEHPLIGGSKKFSPLSIRVLEGILKNLQTGENVNWTDEQMVKSLSDSIK